MTKFCIFIVLFISLTSYLTNHIVPARAQHFISPNYIIDWGNFNMTSGKKSSTNYSLTDTVGQMAPGLYTSAGYLVKAGFQYIYDNLTPFSFTISSLNLDLGLLVPGVGSTNSHTITISTPSGRGYQVMAAQNHSLSLLTGETIPDTTGDNNLASESNSDTWSLATSYGFGFQSLGINTSGAVTGVGTSNIFASSSYFRQFANLQNGEDPQIIMAEDTPVTSHSARVTYKANISAIQPAGNYDNAIIFTAIPKY